MLTLSRPSWLGARKAAREGLYTYMPISARTSALGGSITSYSLGIARKSVWTSPPYTTYQLWRAGGVNPAAYGQQAGAWAALGRGSLPQARGWGLGGWGAGCHGWDGRREPCGQGTTVFCLST